MAGWIWIVIAAAIVVAVIVALVLWRALTRRKTQRLRDRFGPEYDRTAETTGGRREAEAELAAREERRDRLAIRPLTTAARDRYAEQWRTVQAQFVDAPQPSLVAADALVNSVMSERGYPMDDFDQRAADISVDHPQVVDRYRTAHEISRAASEARASTESQRQAMQHYRALLDELLEADRDEHGELERGLDERDRRSGASTEGAPVSGRAS